jgi:hypothetical protein
MLIGVLTALTETIQQQGLMLEQINASVLLADSADNALVEIIFDIWMENPIKTKKGLDLHLILPQNATKLIGISSDKQPTKKPWISVQVGMRDKQIALIQISDKELQDRRLISFGLSYEVPLQTKSLDLSLHVSSLIGNILHYMSPQQDTVPANHANIWLIYNPQSLKAFVDKAASENRLTGTDLLTSHPSFSSKYITSKKDYVRLLWYVSRPSLNVPFYLNAILHTESVEATELGELRTLVNNMSQRISQLEAKTNDSQQLLKSFEQHIESLYEYQRMIEAYLRNVAKQS